MKTAEVRDKILDIVNQSPYGHLDPASKEAEWIMQVLQEYATQAKEQETHSNTNQTKPIER